MTSKIEADLGSDLLLRYALTRRRLALDQANLLRFRLHDSWVERVMEVRHTAPPPGYSPVTHQQILSADRKLFVKVAEATREGVQLQATGRPIDAIWDDMCNHPDVAHLLQPLPGPALQNLILLTDHIPMEVVEKARPRAAKARGLTVFHRRCVNMEQQLQHKDMLCALVIR